MPWTRDSHRDLGAANTSDAACRKIPGVAAIPRNSNVINEQQDVVGGAWASRELYQGAMLIQNQMGRFPKVCVTAVEPDNASSYPCWAFAGHCDPRMRGQAGTLNCPRRTRDENVI